MNFSQALDTALIALVLLFAWIVVDGITQSAIACWKSTERKPSQPVQPIAYHYACPLTCELPLCEPAPALEVPEVLVPTPALPVPSQPIAAAKKLTLAQEVKARCSQVFGYEIKTPADAKAAIINRSDVSFMEAVNLERKGKDFWQAIAAQLDRIEAQRVAKTA